MGAMKAMKKAAMKRHAMKAAAASPAKAMKVMKKAAMKRRAMKAAAPAKAMKAMKKAAMKRRAMKAAAPKAMKAMKKVISARLARRHAFAGKINKTKTGLTKSDLVKNKMGKIVSKKASLRAKKMNSFGPWLAALKKARAELKIKGFSVIKKGTPLYKRAKELYSK